MGSGGQRFWRQGRLSQHDSLDRGATLSAPFAFSAGTASARTSLPAQACDAHIHVYDSRFPAVVGASLHPPDATIEDYRLVQQRMGTERVVLVTPSTYGADNRPMLAGLAQLGEIGLGHAALGLFTLGRVADLEFDVALAGFLLPALGAFVAVVGEAVVAGQHQVFAVVAADGVLGEREQAPRRDAAP